MAYSFQNFSVNQIYTAAQANQTEESIRDHVHGKDGVSAVGLSWAYTTKSADFSVTAADAGKHFTVSPIPYSSGTLNVDFATIGDLGAGWAATFTNVGSRGVIRLNPSTSEKIDAASEFALGLGETITVHSDGTRLYTYPNLTGREVLIHTEVGSTGQIGAKTVTISYNAAWDSFQFIRLRFAFEPNGAANSGVVITVNGGSAPAFTAKSNGDWVYGNILFNQTKQSSAMIGGTYGTVGYADEVKTLAFDLPFSSTNVAITGSPLMQNIKNFEAQLYGIRHGNFVGRNDAPALTL